MSGRIGLKDHSPENLLRSAIGHRPHGTEGPLLDISRSLDHRDLYRLNPQHRTFGRTDPETGAKRRRPNDLDRRLVARAVGMLGHRRRDRDSASELMGSESPPHRTAERETPALR